LLGIPLRVTLGAKAFADAAVELKLRTEPTAERVALSECVRVVCERIEALGGR
jgi:hypothetical protein